MFKNICSKLGVLVLIALVAGCAKYNPHPLSVPSVVEDVPNEKGEVISLNDDLNEIVEMDDEDQRHEHKSRSNIKVAARVLSEGDCRYYFSRRIINKGYRPVQLSIHNYSDEKYIFNSSSINLPVEYRSKIADRLHLDTAQRVLGWGIAGLFVSPFLIPAAVECIKVPEVNRALDRDFDDRVIDLNSRYEIRPGATFNKVFFVKDDEFGKKLKFSLVESKTKDVRSFGLSL